MKFLAPSPPWNVDSCFCDAMCLGLSLRDRSGLEIITKVRRRAMRWSGRFMLCAALTSLDLAGLKTEAHHQGILAAVLGLVIAAPYADLRKARRGIQANRGHVGRPHLEKNDACPIIACRLEQMLQQ